MSWFISIANEFILAPIEMLGIQSNFHSIFGFSHNSKDYIEFLKKLDGRYSKSDKIRLVLDNPKDHSSEKIRKSHATVPERFEFIFSPRHGSWMNLVEGFFSKLIRQMQKRYNRAERRSVVTI